jgi:hypothetical protein
VVRKLPWFSKVLVLAFVQGCLFFLASRFYDRHHTVLAGLVMIVLPLLTGFVARRRLGLSLQGALVSYAVIPFLLAAYLRGIPGLILTKSLKFFLIAIPPTALAWWLAGWGERRELRSKAR